MSEHPDLTRAQQALEDGDVRPILRVAMRARFAADAGRYCECAEPIVTGDALMCGSCLRNNKDQERRRVDAIVRAHEFVPGKHPWMCKVCTNSEKAPRHHGVSAIGRCSWGEERRPT